jgi:transglutaminase-like putative cysteine protease/tetratricopeptide (TPR) repeat protein
VLWFLGLACLASSSVAADAVFHPDLERALAALEAAEGPRAYTALRRIYGTWDRADPVHVEQALREASLSTKLAPAARSYARLLAAYSRNRRGDSATAQAEIRALGFVDQWLVVGPFDNEGKAGFGQPYAPELALDRPITSTESYPGKERPVRWRAVPRAFPYGYIQVSALLRPETSVCAYASTFVSEQGLKKARPISVFVGAGGAYKLFWNGHEVLSDAAYRGADAERSAVSVELVPGTNRLVVKLCGETTSPVASVRLADASGAPDSRLTVSNDLALAEAAVLTYGHEKPSSPARNNGARLEGPLQAFERMASAEKASAEELYAYAEYLVASSGDDPALHTSRNLAQRAAEMEPTIERLLLAARLSEDRNKSLEWLEKAEALAARESAPNLDVLLARAAHARQSPNWRDAFPYIDRVLALDPDHVTAIEAKTELYNQAGLRQTALALVERALARQPRSAALLNLKAAQLKALGRTTEASEAEQRYFAIRGDDRSFIDQRLDLALARNDRAAAERWVDRLLALDGTQWSLGRAARAYRRLGQAERAVAMLERSLELAPEDVSVLRALSDLSGETGNRERQLTLLRKLLELRPQEREVREYLDHIERPAARPDERYAWKPERFLGLRDLPARGHTRRTLRDLTVTTVYENGLASQFRQVVFQPLTDAAAAAARQYAFYYEGSRQMVQLRGSRVYRADGRVDATIESGEGSVDDPSIAMYTSTRAFYVQFPRLSPGDVVELRYRIDDVTPRNEYADYFGDVTYMQSTEPVSNAEYVLITPEKRNVHVDVQMPNLERSEQRSGGQRIHRFFAKEAPAVEPEPAMPPLPEVLGFVHASTYESWQDLGRWYWGFVRDQFDLDDETRKLAREITKNAVTDRDKVNAVYNWVIKNTRYVALEFGVYGYKPRRCVQTVARGWGDCKDKATVIVTLLKELGIESTMVIVRTQMRGAFRSELPSLAPFDHAIAYVPAFDLYLDGTAEYAGTGELPVMDLEALGLLVNEGNAKLVTLPGAVPETNLVRREVRATLSWSGSGEVDATYRAGGAQAASWRSRYHAEATQRDRLTSDLGQDFPGLELAQGERGVQTSDLENVEAPVWIRIGGKAAQLGRREGDQLSIAVTPTERLAPSYASLSQRKQDVRVLGYSGVDQTFTVKLPPGAKVISLPDAVEKDTPFGTFSVRVERAADKLSVHSRLVLKKSRISPKDYAAWQRFCLEADQAFASRLTVGR